MSSHLRTTRPPFPTRWVLITCLLLMSLFNPSFAQEEGSGDNTAVSVVFAEVSDTQIVGESSQLGIKLSATRENDNDVVSIQLSDNRTVVLSRNVGNLNFYVSSKQLDTATSFVAEDKELTAVDLLTQYLWQYRGYNELGDTLLDALLVLSNWPQGVAFEEPELSTDNPDRVTTYLFKVPKTGQTTCYDAAGASISCAGTGQDGDLKKGAAWPSPRFTDNRNGTVTDNLTGLIWLKNANCFGSVSWTDALSKANQLKSGNCGLSDGSAVGQWRLPNVNELYSLLHLGYANPSLSNAAGTGPWTSGNTFLNVQSNNSYWSATSYRSATPVAPWIVSIGRGIVFFYSNSALPTVWPVRGQGTNAVPKTGQTTCYNAAGASISCAGTGQDGDLKKGIAWPSPRFINNRNGTVTDNLTGLIWLKDADCFGFVSWTDALSKANQLKSGNCGLSDGSTAGQWRLPNMNELHSLVHLGYANPSLSNAAGTGKWTSGDAFLNVRDYYWSASSYAYFTTLSGVVNLKDGSVIAGSKTNTTYVWPVRGGQ